LSSNDGKHFEKIFSEQNTGVILGKKFGRKRRKYFGGIFRVSSTDATSSDSRVGGIARPAGGTMVGSGFPARWPTAALWRHWAARRSERRWPV
jgi:hypothetical protein